MGLSGMQDGRERRDLITLYGIINGFEKMDKQNLVLMKEENEQKRGHSEKIERVSVLRTLGSTIFHIEQWIFGTD